MSGHVETVKVSRCGDWHDGNCPGDDRGCTRCKNESPGVGGFPSWIEYDLYSLRNEFTAEDIESWRECPHPMELSHAEFVRQYGRCPDACKVAEQLEIA